MRVKIRTKDFRLFVPVPVTMAGLIIRWIPDRVIGEMRVNIPQPYDALITKQNITMLLSECLDILKENKGLEIVHVEANDGTFVSIKLYIGFTTLTVTKVLRNCSGLRPSQSHVMHRNDALHHFVHESLRILLRKTPRGIRF